MTSPRGWSLSCSVTVPIASPVFSIAIRACCCDMLVVTGTSALLCPELTASTTVIPRFCLLPAGGSS
jgi:hypothetical protein